MVGFLSGACMMGFAVIALFFANFYKRSKQKLFVFFSAAFALFALERIVLEYMNTANDYAYSIYIIRLIGFLLIILGIVFQNLSPQKQ